MLNLRHATVLPNLAITWDMEISVVQNVHTCIWEVKGFFSLTKRTSSLSGIK